MIARNDWIATGRIIEFGPPSDPFGIFVREAGVPAGEALFFLTGFAAGSLDWAALEPYLVARYRLGYVDFLGTGESSKPVRHRSSYMEQAQVARAALGALGFGRFHLVAHDHGVSVAQQFLCDPALRARIASLTLFNGGAYGETAASAAAPDAGSADAPAAAPPTESLARRLAARARISEPLRRLLIPLGKRASATNGGRHLPSHLVRYAAERLEFGPMWESALEEAGVPLNLIWGTRDDRGASVLTRVVAGQKTFPEITTLPDTGSRPHVERPERAAASLAAFVESLERPAVASRSAVLSKR